MFVAHFAGTCDFEAAAAEAGIDRSTVFKYRRKHAAFRAEFDVALEQGYARLEAEAVRQRLVAQERMRDEIAATGEIAAEFERVMKLLARWDRRGGSVGACAIAPGRRRAASFDEAVEALHKRLQALDIPIQRLPPPPAPEEPQA